MKHPRRNPVSRRHLAALVTLILLAPLRSAETAETADPALEFGRRYVEAMNSGDPEVRRAVVREVMSPVTLKEKGEALITEQMERLAGDFGPLEFHHAEVSASRIGETVRRYLHVFAWCAKQDNWLDLQFQLDPDPASRIRQLIFIANVAEPVFLPNGGITDSGTLEWLNAYLDTLIEVEDLSGGILVAVGDRPVFERYYGFADPDRAVPVNAATRFNLGSGNKMFTALGLALLVEEGKVGFDTPLQRFFPDLGDEAWRKTATVGHLVSHTSGVVEYWNETTDGALTRTDTVADIYPFVLAAGVHFAPGEACEYSNSNFILAGLVIEMISGMDYYDFVRERILAPAGMKDTDSYRTDGSAPRLAIPLTGKPQAWVTTRRGHRGSSAGGGYTTAQDMLRFSRRLVAGEIVSPKMLAEMTRSHTDRIPDTQLDYGYGFIRERSADNVQSFGHGGFAPGVNFEYRYFPAQDVTLIAYCNQDNGAYDSLRETVTKLITGER